MQGQQNIKLLPIICRIKKERSAETQRLRCVYIRLGAFLFILSFVCRTGNRGW